MMISGISCNIYSQRSVITYMDSFPILCCLLILADGVETCRKTEKMYMRTECKID